MKDHELKRRELLAILASLPIGVLISCESEPRVLPAVAPLLSPEESLRKLILLVGPWPETDKREAEDFSRRFLQAKQAAGPYLERSGELIRGLASRFPDGTVAVSGVELRGLPEPERALLVNLVKQVYSLVEVRFRVCDEPPFGECQEDRLRYTRAPAPRKV